MIEYGFELRQQIVTNLHLHQRREHALDARKHAAVAIVLVDGDDTRGAAFLLCRRASRLNAHAGQWALPGGRLDPGEDALTAALREVDEELGLRLTEDVVRRLARRLPDALGIRDHAGRAVGGRRADVDALATRGGGGPSHRARRTARGGTAVPHHPGERPPGGAGAARGWDIHAPTGAVLYQFRQVALAGRIDERVDHLEQPVFAWR